MKQITQIFFKGESLTLNFPELFIREKYVKMDSKNSGSTNIEQKSFQPLTIITKRSIFDVAAALDPPLRNYLKTIR